MWQKRSSFQPWIPFALEWLPQVPMTPPPAWFSVGESTMRKISVERVKRPEKALADTSGLDKFPQLSSFLSDTFFEPVNGKEAEVREPGTIWIGARGGILHVILKEPSQGVMCRLDVPSVASLWKLVESALASEGSMWEADPYGKRVGKKKAR